MHPRSSDRPDVIGALGSVFGDIGTSLLYALAAVAAFLPGQTEPSVSGGVSLVLWSLMLVVTLKYVLILGRLDDGGEGGILALAHRLDVFGKKRRALATVAVLGAALLIGDAVITPAISVLSAIEGLSVTLAG